VYYNQRQLAILVFFQMLFLIFLAVLGGALLHYLFKHADE
jgi:hypothetical protein